MATALLSNISTLVIKLPDYLVLTAYCDRPRTKKNIIKSIIELLQPGAAELLYVGRKPHRQITYFDPVADAADTTIIQINVIENCDMYFNLSGTRETLLKRFKKELVYNNEHILIDNTQVAMGKTQRLIEIYTNNRHVQRKASQPFKYAASVQSYRSI